MEPVIRRYGGIASRAELLAAGWTPTDLWLADKYGDLDRIRRGWYASSDLPDDARAAWAAGGPLACVSALLHHGMLPPDDDDAALGLHIAIAADAHRIRRGPDEARAATLVVPHWSTADRCSGSRLAVSPSVALRQARGCTRAVRARVRSLPRAAQPVVHHEPRMRGLSSCSVTVARR
ncbi:type IV toxin-antitoxin system AbiEi family antitoxin domain-containing protein [Microcella alkalica]|uniref:type IV toxin-antitoxin system AbiEi family antitoxin domain-containing protein n=1 Tax=Microcella alkalica TaxID=355930 RepID=UPI00145E9FED|nr:type IV toxin-antitoxin system AbiEi family antitoxin domain-containing protein [Microcella alkalica]